MLKYLFFLIMSFPLCFLNYFWLKVMMLLFILIFMFLTFSGEIYFSNISYMLGMDLLSFVMVLLSIWISLLMVLSSEKIKREKIFSSFFLVSILMLLISLILTFCSMNLFMFYLFFEVSLIPTLILIMGWGYQPERLQAGIYLLFYTIVASLPMMLAIFYCNNVNKSLDYSLLNFKFMDLYLYFCMILVFLVKMPMFFIHLWLPKAHVEAPVAGSMILAGIMLKLGGYGLIRFVMMFEWLGLKVNMMFISISLVGGVIISLICIRQYDMKSLIAYSSVAHMGLALGGIMTLNYWGLSGAFMMMVAHGLCSSGLFCLANMNYERLNSRSLYLNKGLINIMPMLSLWWFLLISSNMAAPPSLNLFSEIMLINSIVSYGYDNMFFLMMMCFLSAVYSLYLYSFSQHGKFYSGLFSFSMINSREFILLLLHWVPLNFLILKGMLVTLWI
uniref:NADH dehydrogenase subunit 4 n=1 Tax=Metoecus javanus TaxID=2873716 RepID=UPI001FF597CD|nr:NADH dehydrogenase subunit 4 [Metoecus javanus]UOI84449.1 NADH dehydrogenase subunit 4 [Metoecus javanus]